MNKREALIIKLYRGKCSQEELEELLNMIQQNPIEEDNDTVMETLWQQLENYPVVEQARGERIISKTLDRINKETAIKTVIKKSPTKTSRRLFIQIASAAAVLLLLTLPLYLFWNNQQQPIIVQTAFAEQKTIELPDKSKVKLNANSSIRYSKNWQAQATRKVWLEGEAYFEVSKQLERAQKFQVITKDLTVEVLGTIFNVNTRAATTKVFLEEGKVNLDIKTQEEDIAMTPGELVVYSSLTNQSEKKFIEKQKPASWKNGTVTYLDNPLEEILEKIQEIYGIEIDVENTIQLQRKFRIGIPVDNLNLTYQVLKEATKLEIEKKEKKWLVK